MNGRDASPAHSAGAKSPGSLHARASGLSPQFSLSIGLLAVIIGACFFYLRPQVDLTAQRIADVNSAIVALQIQLDGLEAKAAKHRKLRADYAALEVEGFLGVQQRLPAIRRLEALRHEHRITGLEYQILPADSAELSRPPERGVTLVTSKIILTMRGYLDRDIISFVTAVQHELPGHLTVETFEINKLAAPNATSLAKIRKGRGPDLVNGVATLLWRVARPMQQGAGL